MDVNGDGYTDFITGGWFGQALQWRENPAGDPAREWTLHTIGECGNVETTRAWDIDGDGQLEIVPNTPPFPQRVYKLVTDADGRGTGEFTEHILYDGKSGHGFGFGDINGDGRGDLVLCNGWLEAPEDPLGGEPWTLHEEFDLGSAIGITVILLVVIVEAVDDQGQVFCRDRAPGHLCSKLEPLTVIAALGHKLDPARLVRDIVGIQFGRHIGCQLGDCLVDARQFRLARLSEFDDDRRGMFILKIGFQ